MRVPCDLVGCAVGRTDERIRVALLHAQPLEPCPDCGTYLLRRTATGQVYCPLCEQP